jgi:hypothetical protein
VENKKTKHTPAPWYPHGEMITTMHCNYKPLKANNYAAHVELIANAHLIASAPDLLSALETICDECTDLSFDHLCLIKNAVRKANGESL